MYELSNPSHFKPPCLLFYLFIVTPFHLDIRRSDATHAHILQRPVFRGNLPIDIVCHRISFLCFDSKYLRDPIWRVTFLKDRLECAYTVPSHLLWIAGVRWFLCYCTHCTCLRVYQQSWKSHRWADRCCIMRKISQSS